MANSYSDGIKVKISEKYKPPCRISMPISYSQRLTLNKQIQDSYDFNLEKSALEKLNKLKDIKKNLAEERKQRLDSAKQEFEKKIEQEKAKQLETEQVEAKLAEKSNTTEIKPQTPYTNIPGTQLKDYTNHSNSSHIQPNYITKNGILMPIPVTNYSTNASNFLMPTSTIFQPQQPTMTKSFNLSDFESDTSSPFDNMELKSINDLEELAQVLKTDRNNFQQQQNVYPNSSVYENNMNYSSSVTKSFGNYSANSYPQYNQTNPNLSQNPRLYRQNPGVTENSLTYNRIPNTYSQVNNIYNPHSTTFSQYNNPYATPSNYSVASENYSNQINGYMYNVPQQNIATTQYYPMQHSMQKSNCKSVPDLVKSLEKELDSTHLNDTVENSRHSISSSYYTTDVPVPTRPKSTDSVYPKTKNKVETFLLNNLDIEQREICKNVSLMGFPLDRVVRVCEAVGHDQKKIVDHLLALSELLDLGFAEKDASEALMKNDNDRDKALDLLIS